MTTTRKLLTFVSALSLSVGFSGLSAASADDSSESVAINLVHLLVEEGVLSKEKADALIRKAEAKAEAARPAAADGTVRVTYVPETVRQQMREDIRQDVMRQAREENWADPREVPAWTKKLRLSGDIRFRYDGSFFGGDNDPTDAINFNSLNRGSPYNASVTNTVLPPLANVNEDRARLRLRARLALDADLGEGFTAGLRLATGSDSSPVSTNQSMGADGLGSKYALWLDRAFVKYDAPALGGTKLAVTVGRFENPFFATDLVWDDDLGFDGILLQAGRRMGRWQPFATFGLFPVYNTDFNFSSRQLDKFKSDDKWLHGVQLGTGLELAKDLSLKVAAAYYSFTNIAGKLSDPLNNPNDDGSTDTRRPSFAQKGNTYMALRNNLYTGDPASPWYQQDYQYYGLGTPFRELALTARLDYARFDPVQLALEFEFVKNLAYDEDRINRLGAQNNFAEGASGLVDGGDMGWTTRLVIGQRVLEKRWDWQASIAYKYLETDAVVDGFTDSDFGLGGTNLKGFVLGASVGLSKNVNARLRWLSADNVSATSFSVDVLQIDINAKF
ncbi:putative porin [Termitidicoccus mucosus]|uniref:Outer membrane receptor for ferric coprogen and ferric-rhodotorulic acid n=1 Tax=Termitidicoccus mucosus TaxID=1184151 RepID=A0A178IME0_9BACT|nr:hypothetical protein AW736_05270 [Opitutaceae bacterium TSB47]